MPLSSYQRIPRDVFQDADRLFTTSSSDQDTGDPVGFAHDDEVGDSKLSLTSERPGCVLDVPPPPGQAHVVGTVHLAMNKTVFSNDRPL